MDADSGDTIPLSRVLLDAAASGALPYRVERSPSIDIREAFSSPVMHGQRIFAASRRRIPKSLTCWQWILLSFVVSSLCVYSYLDWTTLQTIAPASVTERVSSAEGNASLAILREDDASGAGVCNQKLGTEHVVQPIVS